MADTREDRSERVAVRILRADEMSDRDRHDVFEIFEESYREANHEYLQRSIDRIGLLALARLGGRPAGFAISNFRWMDLRGFAEPQLVVLHGMRCVVPGLRHRGLFGRLNQAVMEQVSRDVEASGRSARRQLHCGRWGHASRAGGRDDPSSVPRAGTVPGEWQQQVGLAVAEAYGSRLDPETFVCIGWGTPIGYPNEEFEATEAELKAFAPVNRDRGDNLLVISWTPDPPPGWVQTA
ncbi:MAG: hypothetical protein ACE5EF_13515 [Dehalococcoidia bacterium]